MVGYAGSPTYTAYVDMTLTRSKVKVKVTGLLNFRQRAKPCMLAAMTAAPLRGFLVFLFVCTVTDFPAAERARGVKFCMRVGLLSGQGFSTFGEYWLAGSHGAAVLLPV